MTLEDTAAKIEANCKLYREIVQLIPVIRSVLARFDGKIYNKRFETAVNKAALAKFSGELYISTEKCFDGSRAFVYGHKKQHYNNSPCLCYIDLTDEKRINAEKSLKSCNEKYSAILKECADKEAGIQIMPQIIGRLDELYKLQQALIKQIPRDLYYSYDIEHVLKYGAAWVFPELRENS